MSGKVKKQCKYPVQQPVPDLDSKPVNVLSTNEDFNNHIELLFKKNEYLCNHVHINKYYTGDFICDTIVDLMTNMIDNNMIISESNIEEFYAVISYRSHNSAPCCIQYDTIKLIEFTNKLFTYQLPSLNTLTFLFPYSIFDSCIMCIKENKNFSTCSNKYIDFIIENKLSEKYNSKDILLCEFVMENIIPSPTNLLQLLKCSNNFVMENLITLIENFDGDLSELNFMEIACEGLPYTKDTIIALLHKNCQVSEDNFKAVCKKGDIESMKFILEISRITITSEHFKILLNMMRKKNAYGYKKSRYDDSDSDSYDYEHNMMKIELFFQHGFVPTRDDIKLSIMNSIEINNIDRFEIDMDREMLELCRQYGFYPKYNFSCISAEMLQLQKACKIKDISVIKKLIKEHNLVPDSVCMENVSYYKENNILEYLVSCGGKVTLRCINKRLSNYRHSAYVTTLIDHFEEENTRIIKEYEDRITELERQLSEKNNSQVTQVAQVKQSKQIKQTKQTKQIENTPKYNIINVNVTDENMTEYKQKYKNKRVPHKNFIELFAVIKTHKVSPIEFKKLLIEKIQNESWICEYNKTLICIPLKYRNYFGLPNDVKNINDVVSFNDIDKLIYLFYKTNYE